MMNNKIEQIWERTRALRPTIEAHRGEGDGLHHLPDTIARAIVEANVYRLLLPHEFGGEDVDPITYYDLVEEVSSYDGSAGWNYSIGSSTPVILGDLSPIRLGAIFVSPDSCIAASASPPGRAVEVEGGYRVKGRFAWASGVHQARWVVANCFVFDGDQMRKSAVGTPVALGLVMPKQDCNVLDTWHVVGMRGTGSTEFEVDGAFVPKDMAIRFFGADSQHPHPIFHLPPTYFGYNHVSVMNGIARSALAGLKALANTNEPRRHRSATSAGWLGPSGIGGRTKASLLLLAVHEARGGSSRTDASSDRQPRSWSPRSSQVRVALGS
jgi:alkylation response protein AidB-like acyl-CoA dehydrogenase